MTTTVMKNDSTDGSRHFVFLLSTLLAFGFTSCQSASFTANSPRKPASADATPKPTPTAEPTPTPEPTSSGTTPPGNITDNGGQNNGGTTDNGGTNDGGITNGEDDCKETNQWNIVLVFDNSGSQLDTDPGPLPLRQLGAQKFVQTFSDYLLKAPQKKVHLSVVKFASDAEILTRDGLLNLNKGWYELTTENRPKIDQAVIDASTNPDGGTRYSPAFLNAVDLMNKKGTSVNEKTHRNFVVFLTDGAPNLTGFMPSGYPAPTETELQIQAPVNILVNTYGAAIIVMATGTRLGDDHLFGGEGGISDTKAEQIAQGLALPAVGITWPTHAGKYRRASTPDEAQASWDLLFNDMMVCH